jgi:hypothetical protein
MVANTGHEVLRDLTSDPKERCNYDRHVDSTTLQSKAISTDDSYMRP